jgi:hypothetical protein
LLTIELRTCARAGTFVKGDLQASLNKAFACTFNGRHTAVEPSRNRRVAVAIGCRQEDLGAPHLASSCPTSLDER